MIIGRLEQAEENEAEYVKRIKELKLIVEKYKEDEKTKLKQSNDRKEDIVKNKVQVSRWNLKEVWEYKKKDKKRRID